MIRTAAVRPRDRLAALILAALGEAAARRDLAALAAGDDETLARWLGEDGPEWIEPVRERARRATLVLGGRPLGTPRPDLAAALARAAALFDAGLYFEVHELLEPYWAAASGGAREGLQGLIQIAVGLQHLANDNVPGARTLLREGSERLTRGALPGLDLARFAGALGAGLGAGVESFHSGVPGFPRGERREGERGDRRSP